jgi:hypothetical protein
MMIPFGYNPGIYRLIANVINLRNAFESPPLKKGDLGGFSNGDNKSPLAPLFLKGGILALS